MMKRQGIRDYFRGMEIKQYSKPYEDNEKKCRWTFIIGSTHVKKDTKSTI